MKNSSNKTFIYKCASCLPAPAGHRRLLQAVLSLSGGAAPIISQGSTREDAASRFAPRDKNNGEDTDTQEGEATSWLKATT